MQYKLKDIDRKIEWLCRPDRNNIIDKDDIINLHKKESKMKERLKKYFSSFSAKPVDFIIDENYSWKAVYIDGKILPSFCFQMTIKQAMYIITGE